MRALRFGAALLLAACLPLKAQDFTGLTGTIGIEADTVMRSGQFAGCTLNYRAAVQDYVYRRGALVAVSGSFNLHLVQSGKQTTVAPMLKVGVLQVFPQLSGKPEAPTFAYLQSARGTTAGSVLADDISDTPGFRIFVLTLDQNTAQLISDVMDGESVFLYFSRTKDGLDVKVPLDMRVIDSKSSERGIEPVRGDSTLNAFRNCFVRLGKEMK